MDKLQFAKDLDALMQKHEIGCFHGTFQERGECYRTEYKINYNKNVGYTPNFYFEKITKENLMEATIEKSIN